LNQVEPSVEDSTLSKKLKDDPLKYEEFIFWKLTRPSLASVEAELLEEHDKIGN